MDYLEFLKLRRDDTLAHSGSHKYIDKKWRNGHWVYIYDYGGDGGSYNHHSVANANLKKSAEAKSKYDSAKRAYDAGKVSKEYMDEVEFNTRARDSYRSDLADAMSAGKGIRMVKDFRNKVNAEGAAMKRADRLKAERRQQAVSNTISTAKDHATKLTGKAAELAERLRNQAGTAASSAKSTAQNASSKAKTTAAEAMANAKQKATTAAANAKTTASNAVSTAKQKATTAAATAKDKTTSAISTGKSKVNSAISKVQSSANDAASSVKDKAADTKKKVDELLGNLKKKKK